MNQAPISVIIACYNAEKWLEATLTSVVQQISAPLEIIVVDDGSTDRSAAIVADKFPAVTLIQVKNGGPSKARNFGAQFAKGKWLQFLDADDLIHPQKFVWQQYHLNTMEKSIGFVFSEWQRLAFIESNWVPMNPIESTELIPDLYAHVLDKFTHLGSGLVRKTWFDKIGGFDTAHEPIEDVNLQLRLIHSGARFYYIPTHKPVFYYRQLPKSFSQQNHRSFMDACYANIRVTDTFLHENHIPTVTERELLARHYAQVARYYAEHDDIIFNYLSRRIEELVPGFVPSSPRSLATLSKVVGYRNAEQFSVWYRRLKRSMTRRVS